MPLFTLVRHSRYAVAGDPTFEDAVEVRELTLHQEYSVRSAGGVVFPTLADANRAASAANDPDGAGRARAAGHFSSCRLGNAEIYVPTAARGTRATTASG